MTVSKRDVEHVARLAALALDEDSLAELTRQIAGILAYVSQLESVDPSGVQPETASPHAGPWQGLREDAVHRATLARPLSELAPHFRDGLFVVPRLGGVGDDAGRESRDP